MSFLARVSSKPDVISGGVFLVLRCVQLPADFPSKLFLQGCDLHLGLNFIKI